MEISETALTFVVEFYEILAGEPGKIDGTYADGARLQIFEGENPVKTTNHNYSFYIPKGKRRIETITSEESENQLIVHVAGHLDDRPIDEVFVCNLSDTTILVQYHSVHLGFFKDAIKLPERAAPKPVAPPPPPQPAQEVKDFDEMDSKLCVYVTNLNFNYPPAEFIPILERYGRIEKYAQNNGQLVAQFADQKQMFDAINKNTDGVTWNGRKALIRRRAREFRWYERN